MVSLVGPKVAEELTKIDERLSAVQEISNVPALIHEIRQALQGTIKSLNKPWKYSIGIARIEIARRELEVTRKKKQALDELLNAGKISQPTYDDLDKGFTEAIAKLEADQKTLADKNTARSTELEDQLKSLEVFLAKLEMHHAAGEVDDEAYKRQENAISLGIETTKQKLSVIKECLAKLVPEAEKPAPPPAKKKRRKKRQKGR